MSEPIGPGDWVEYLGTGISPGYVRLTPHALYRVVDVISREDGGWAEATVAGLILAGPQSNSRFGWAIHNFRPIYRPKRAMIEGLLKPVKEDA